MSYFFTKAFEKLPVYWKLSTVRLLVYMFMVGWAGFNTGTEGYDTFSDMTRMAVIKLFGNVIFGSMFGVLLAFLDQSLTKITGTSQVNETSTLKTDSTSGNVVQERQTTAIQTQKINEPEPIK